MHSAHGQVRPDAVLTLPLTLIPTPWRRRPTGVASSASWSRQWCHGFAHGDGHRMALVVAPPSPRLFPAPTTTVRRRHRAVPNDDSLDGPVRSDFSPDVKRGGRKARSPSDEPTCQRANGQTQGAGFTYGTAHGPPDEAGGSRPRHAVPPVCSVGACGVISRASRFRFYM